MSTTLRDADGLPLDVHAHQYVYVDEGDSFGERDYFALVVDVDYANNTLDVVESGRTYVKRLAADEVFIEVSGEEDES